MRIGIGIGLWNNPRPGGGGSAPAEYPTTLTDTITYKGEAYTLNKTTRVGYALNGQPFIVSDTSALTLTAASTTSAVVNSYVANGIEFDPQWMTSGRTQGVDEIWQYGASGTNELGASGSVAYDNVKNVHPARTGVPFALTGKCGRLVQFIRRGDYALGQFCIPSKIIHINVVPTVPPAGAICPIYNGSGGVQWLTTAHMNKTIFRGSGYVTNQPTLATAVSAGYFPDCDWPIYIDNQEMRRGAWPYSSLWNNGYTSSWGPIFSAFVNACHAEGAAGVSDAIMYRMMTLGAQCVESVRRGIVQRAGAGQNSGLKAFAALVAMSANDSTILSESYNFESNETHQHFTVTSAFLGVASEFPGSSGTGYNNRWTYLPDHVGRAMFFHGDQAIPPLPGTGTGLYDSSPPTRYELTSGGASSSGVAAILQFQNGPGGIDGTSYMLGGGAYNLTANPRAASLLYWKQYTTYNEDMNNLVSVFAEPAEFPYKRTLLQNVYANYVSQTLVQPPSGFSPETNQTAYLNVGAGSVSYDWRNADLSIETVTQWDNRYTIDGGRSFLVENNVASNGTRSSLPVGIPVGVQFRRRSASGTGPWSVNTPKTTASGTSNADRFLVTPTGTPSGTPTNVQAPEIMYRPYPNWAGPYYEPFTGSAAQNQILNGGVGWWTGNLVSPGRLQKWRRGLSTDISGATSLDYTVTSADAGQNVYLGISYDGGSTWTWSAPVACAAAVYPAMTLTQFDGVNDYLQRTTAPSGTLADGRKITLAFMADMQGADSAAKTIYRGMDAAGTSSGDNIIQLVRTSTNRIQLTLRNSTPATIYTATSNTGTANGWTASEAEKRLLISIDLDAGTYLLYFNDTAISMGAATTAAGNINFTGLVRQFLMASPTGTELLQADYRYFFMHNDFIDLTVQGNRDKFLTANIGNRGEGVFGVDAMAMVYGPAASIGTNYGTGGNFTLVGSVTDVP